MVQCTRYTLHSLSSSSSPRSLCGLGPISSQGFSLPPIRFLCPLFPCPFLLPRSFCSLFSGLVFLCFNFSMIGLAHDHLWSRHVPQQCPRRRSRPIETRRCHSAQFAQWPTTKFLTAHTGVRSPLPLSCLTLTASLYFTWWAYRRKQP